MNNTSNDVGTETSKRNKKRSDDVHGVDLKKYLEAGKTVGRSLEQQINERPYLTLGIVGATGFFLGSLIGSRIGQLAVAIGIGYAATKLIENNDIDVKEVAKKVSDAL